MNIKAISILNAVVVTCAVHAGAVRMGEDKIVLPTYSPGGYDKTPIFYAGRVYQGAQGRVYPYPMQDVLHDEKVDETYKYLTLENDWLQMGLLPEHGGHLLNFTDKATGFETFYRQHVIKPALIGMLGAWISGGVEWNFPHHHRATTAMPIDWRMVANADGSKTIWIGETELRRRLKWTIGLSLLPDRAVLKAENIFMNRQPWIESMIYWANVSVHCGDDYQILFPPSMHLGFDHHKNFWTSYPIGPRKEDLVRELLPSQRSKYADDISGTMDLSWWKNFTIESRSIFGMDPDNAWLAGYDHKRQCGTAHISNRHITVGKKFFLWGNFPEAHVWDKVLTDSDGSYLELMVGCWSDNQPDYSWIAPYETRKVEQFWFPVKGIGGVKNVTIDGAVNVDRLADDKLLVGFHSTRVLKDCVVRVFRTGETGGADGTSVVFEEKGIAIDPNTPWCKTVKVEAGSKDQEFTAAIADASGKVFLSYTPVPPQGDVKLPPEVENPKPPREYTSAELAYEIGLRLDQFHNGILDPVPYYERALEIDPDYTKANLAMGVRLAKNGSFAEAKPYLEKAVARATQNFTRALDAAPEYYLALVERHLGNLKRAEDLFWRCTWRLTHKKESYVEIARIAALRGDWEEALKRIDDALALGQDEAKLWTMKGIFLKKLKVESAKCKVAFDKALSCDPLEYWAVVEKDGLAAAEKNRGLKAQQLLECICDYWGIGLYDEVIALCDVALAKAAAEKPYATEGALPLKETIAACDNYKNALFGYFKGAALLKKNDKTGQTCFIISAAMPTDYCFPNRLEEEEVLMMAAKAAPELANTWYYLGCCEWNHDRKDAGLADWKRCVELCESANPVNPVNPVQKPSSYALALRCIGFALSHPGTYFANTGVPTGIPSREAYEYYLKSLEAEPHFRTLDEAGRLAERIGLPAGERIALMEKYRSTVDKYDPCVLRLAYAYNAAGRYKEAHDILTTRRFHVWEGGEGLLVPFVESCIGLGRELMAKGDYKAALKYFGESTTYPENLQAGRPGDAGSEPKSRYFMAQCKKALGDEAGYKAELENSLKGWIHAGEMDYWRVKALRELGRGDECAPLIAEMKQAIAELMMPVPEVIHAYAKFAGDNSALERTAKAREKADALKKLLEEIDENASQECPKDTKTIQSLERFPVSCEAVLAVEGCEPSLLPKGKNFKLVWHDEFDGDGLDELKWSYRTNYWGCRAKWFAAPEAGTVEVKDGLLRMKLIKLPGGQFVSPQLQTGETVWDAPPEEGPRGNWPLAKRDKKRVKPRFAHRYGYYECRCRLQQMPGWWSAFWMQAPMIGASLDPRRAGIEHDIMESFDPGEMIPHCFHMDGYGGDHKMFRCPRVERNEDAILALDKTKFHVFGMLWEPDGYTLYVDGRQHGPKVGGGECEAVSETEEFVLLTTEAKWYRNDNATGKGVPELEAAAASGDEFLVDFVRVYDIDPAGE